MLQQTQVDTVIPYYIRFLARFPSVRVLAAAQTEQVLKLWENLGYYSRARNLHAAAKEILARWGGSLPQNAQDLLSLPGIGPYTASAILSIAFAQPAAAIDGNVLRVISRLFALSYPLGSPESREQVHDLASSLLSKKHPGRFNQAMMELGASVCTPRVPSCLSCPLKGLCRAYELGLQERLPVARKRSALLHRQMVAAIFLDRKHRVLVAQRPASGLLGGLWRFPGGEIGARESPKDAARRAVREEFGLSIRVKEEVALVKHAYTHFRVTFHVYRCFIVQGRTTSLKGLKWRWVSPEELRRLALSKAEWKILDALQSCPEVASQFCKSLPYSGSS
jgi:A/G-specific adenine glycosylase